MEFTEAELKYYSGLPDIIEFPIWMLMKGNFGSGERENDPGILNSSNELTGFLTEKGLAYMRNKWAMRLHKRYSDDHDSLVINSRREKLDASHDFSRFWSAHGKMNFVEAMTAYNSMRELFHVPEYSLDAKAPYNDIKWVSEFPNLNLRWAQGEACEFGEVFDEFHFRHADMDFVKVVVSYIAVLPYCWLLKEDDNA